MMFSNSKEVVLLTMLKPLEATPRLKQAPVGLLRTMSVERLQFAPCFTMRRFDKGRVGVSLKYVPLW